MPSVGDSFRGSNPGAHLYVVITSPAGADNHFSIVNLTSKRNRPGEDHTCVLHPGEHPFIVHETIVRYVDAAISSDAAFRAAFSQGYLQMEEPVTPEVLKKIQQGALASRFTPQKIKAAVQQELNLSE